MSSPPHNIVALLLGAVNVGDAVIGIAVAVAAFATDGYGVRSCGEMHDSWLCTFDSKLLHLPNTLNISSRLVPLIYANKLSGGTVNVAAIVFWPQ